MKLSSQQKLFLAVIILALIPTVGVIVWGVAKSVTSAEFRTPAWVAPKR